MYQGVYKIVISIMIVSLFYIIPFEKIKKRISTIIFYCSNYTMGIFCIHFLIGKLLNDFIFLKLGWKTNAFSGCILIYIICLGLSVVISKVHFNCKKLVV